MAKVVMYTKPGCPFCLRAKGLFENKKIPFTERDGIKLRAEMQQRANGRNTFPQIFINEEHIGGCDDLFALEEQGKLDVLLG